MSKVRQLARAERERAAAARAAAAEAARQKAASTRTRQERRSLAWRRLRLWQHGPSFRRNRERWGALATLVLIVLLLAWLFTHSVAVLIGTALVCAVGTPVLVLLFVDGRSR